MYIQARQQNFFPRRATQFVGGGRAQNLTTVVKQTNFGECVMVYTIVGTIF